MNTHRQIEDEILSLFADNSTTARSRARRLLISTEQQLLAIPQLNHLSNTTSFDTTISGKAGYTKPTDMKKIKDLTIKFGSTTYPLRPFENEERYLQITQLSTQTSDIPSCALVTQSEIFIYPTPNSTGNTVTNESNTSTSTTEVTTKNPIYSISGVYLATDTDKTGTNYYTGGSFSGYNITLGTALPGGNTDVIIDYVEKNIIYYYKSKISDIQDIVSTATTGTSGTTLKDSADPFSLSDVGRSVVNIDDNGSQRVTTVASYVSSSELVLTEDIGIVATTNYAITNESKIPADHIYSLIYRPLAVMFAAREDIKMSAYFEKLFVDAKKELRDDMGSITTASSINDIDVEIDPFYPHQSLDKV